MKNKKPHKVVALDGFINFLIDEVAGEINIFSKCLATKVWVDTDTGKVHFFSVKALEQLEKPENM